MLYRIKRADRAARDDVNVGSLCYLTGDAFGCAADDTRNTGIEHVSVSFHQDGYPFFTIPREDIEPLPPHC